MSAAEAPKSEQIQANVAAALSRLRGELGAASSPVASPTPIPLPKTGAEPAPEPIVEPVALAPLPAGPVRSADAGGNAGAVRPFEPILNAMSAGNSNSAASNDSAPAPVEGAKPDLFGRLRADPNFTTDRAAAAMANANEAKPDSQPDLLTGMEVPPAPPPPLGSFDAEDEVNGRGRRMRNRLLVLAAVVVVLGGAAWAWKSSHRTPDGPVPVIAADTTPEKVKPEDEGGMQVPNQNVEILNGQSTTAEQPAVLPPPEQPVAPPTNETTDQANAAPQAPAITDAPKPAEPAPATSEGTGATSAEQSAAPSADAPAIPSVSAPEPGQTAAAPTPAPIVPEPQAQQAAPAPAEATPAPATTAEQPAAPAAPAAPATTTTKAAEPAPAPKAETTQTAAVAAAPAKPSVAPTAGGSARVQLAAVKSEALAKAEWAKLQKAHPSLLGALTLNVQAVDKGGSKLYRIQAGPLTKAQAKELCGKLKAEKQDCLVAK